MPDAGQPTPAKPPQGNRRFPGVGLWSVFWRPTVSHVVVGLLVLLVALTVVLQVRARSTTDEYAGARRADLIQILDSLSTETARLEDERARLQQTKQELSTGADKQAVARAEATKRIDVLRVLAGTSKAQGPGVTLVLLDPEHKLTPELLLDCVEELRDAGAEVIEVNDQVRLVANSWFGSDQGSLVVDGTRLTEPITIDAIGDPNALEGGLRFRGGIVSQVQGPDINGSVSISTGGTVVIDSVVSAPTFTYAQPVR